MRASLSVILILAAVNLLWAQPPNDDCSNATTLNLTMAPSCPSTSPVTNNFNFTNVDATPVSPYPIFGTCPSGSTTGPAAEVWFTFTATANRTTITLTGLSNPNMVIYQGNNCISMQAINCTSGSGNATMVTNTLIGENYFLLVSGGDVDDQGSFSLQVQSNNLCNSCAPPGAITLTTNPPPINGTYTSGQLVQVCVRVNEWDGNAAGTIEWLHAVTFQFGADWDQTSMSFQPPASCDNSGTWSWYDSWTGCNTGDTFGPGFAYDSSSGIGCGGSANDGDPGNNWGDGAGGCSNIPNASQPYFEFCVNINVSDCPPAMTGGDLGIVIDVYSDGDSGSWTQTGCNSGQTYSTSASVVCCNDLPPLVTPTDPTCYTESNGSIEMWGNGGFDPSEVFNYYVFDSGNNIVWECLACVGDVTTPSDLPPGTYTVTAINVATDCPRSEVVTLNEPDPPMAMGFQSNEPCPGDDAILEGSVDVGGGSITYSWTGPSGQMVDGQTVAVQEAGEWEVVAIVDGCPSLPGTVDVTFVDFMTNIMASATEVCAEEIFTLTATNGMSFTWTNQTTGEVLGNGQMIDIALTNSATILLEADNGQGCLASSTIFITINPLPNIVIDVAGNLCDNEFITLTALGAGAGGTYIWDDTGTDENPREFENLPAGFYSFSVSGTDANGCSSSGEVFFDVFASPIGDLVLDNFIVCAGEPVTVTATADDLSSVFWYDGVAPPNTNPITLNPTGPTAVAADITNSNGCTVTVTTDISIEDPPPPISAFCGTQTPNSVEIFWDAQAGADYYELTVDGGPVEIVNGTSYTESGLAPGQSVTFTVVPVGADLCPMMPTTITCMTQDCAPVDLSIDPVADICLTPVGPAPFDLSFTTDTPGGTPDWSGPGITNASAGTFNPAVAGTGTHTITLEYTIGDCPYTATLDITINNTPTADFMVNPTQVCIGQSATVTYTGSAGPGATYDWVFGIDANADPGNGPGPHDVYWSTTGTKTITLTVTENGCTSEVYSETIEVDQELLAPVISCAGSTTTSVSFSWTDVPDAAGYTVSVLTGQSGTQSGNTYTVTGLMPGEAVTIEVTGISTGFCGAVAAQFTCSAEPCPAYTIDITPVADICLTAGASPVTLNANVTGGAGSGALTWSGTGVTGNQFNPITAGAGTHTITATYTEGPCVETEIIDITVIALPTSTFTVMPDTVCTGEAVTVMYTGDADVNTATFNWTFNGCMASPTTGPGPISVTWAGAGNRVISLTVQENGCTSLPSTDTVTVVAPLAAPVINCTSSTSSITFSWAAIPGADTYAVNVVSGPAGTLDLNALTYTVTGLNSGDEVTIDVTAISDDSPCPDPVTTATCVAEDCPTDVVIAIDPVADICLDANTATIDLNATVTGGNGGGTLTWSGTGVTDMQNGIFDPQVAGEGTFTINANYQEGNCTYNNSATIDVFPIPTSDFVADLLVCQGDTVTVSYTGSASGAATFDWTFTNGVVVTDNGSEQVVTWPTAGDQTITLAVTENGCTSADSTQTVTVNAPLAPPAISCMATTTSVIFSWPAVPGATSYQVNVLSGPNGTYDSSALTYTVTGLMAGDVVDIEVTAVGPAPCGNSVATGSCTADPCPTDVVIAIDPVPSVCLDAMTAPFNLSATVTGGAGGGTLSWSGNGITNVTNGTFAPTAEGSFTVVATYVEDNCSWSDSTTIDIFPVPTADFTVDAEVCEGEEATVTYTGTASAAADFAWDFDGGTADPGTGIGPHTVIWPGGGTPTVSLTVTENNCTSEPFETTLMVFDSLVAPVISCDSDNTSITFSWPAVAGATGYTVDILTGPMGTLAADELSYTVTGLNPGDEVSIQLNIATDSPCGGISTTATCFAQACAPLAFAAIGYGPFCEDAGSQTLAPQLEGGNGPGTFTWTGTGLTDPSGSFDPALAGVGDHDLTLQYSLTGCTYDTVYTVTVLAVPEAAFTVDSPICVTESSTITFTGTAGVGATYDWDFDGGTATGTDAGPYDVSWPAAGTFTVSLTVTEAGCVSNTFTAEVVVDPVIEPVVIVCQETTNTSITFAWDPVANADTYTVAVLQGPTGTQNGNTYTVDGLAPDDVVTIEVTASGTSSCGASVATGECVAQACQPLTLALDGPTELCAGESATLTFDLTTGQAGDFIVTYSLDAGTSQQMTVTDGDVLTLPNLQASTTILITDVTSADLADCSYPQDLSWDITVQQPPTAGDPEAGDALCFGTVSMVNLGNMLVGADAGGTWTETSGPGSTGGAFNAANGTFSTGSQAPGTYQFTYAIDGGLCADASATVEVEILPLPTVNAGQDQELTCNMGMVVLGNSATTSGPGVIYNWTTTNPNTTIPDPGSLYIDISAPGLYTLEVTDANGCFNRDEVVVTASQDAPVADPVVSEITCYGDNNGAINLSGITGGQPPYSITINDGAPTTETFYGNLGGGIYDIVITDANGCFTELSIELIEPAPVAVDLMADLPAEAHNTIELGEGVDLQALFDPAVVLDTILWVPDSIGNGLSTRVHVMPDETSMYRVTIVDANGCSDSDFINIIVNKERQVYIPSAFSPNGDGTNDILYIQGDDKVANVKSFLIFNRWGESVFENYDFQVNDPLEGWDGTYRGQMVNSAVYVYYAEVEFIDGEVVLFKGDVVVMH